MNLSKNIFSFALLAVTSITFYQCAKEQQNEEQTKPVFSTKVGAVISSETARRWLGYTYTTGAKLENHLLTPQNITAILQAKGSLGVALHHTQDDNGAYHLLAITIVSGNALWDSPLIIDTHSGQTVNSLTAKTWADNYIQASAPGSIRYHFFGLHVFEDIQKIETYKRVEIQPALNDGGKPQLLLMVMGGDSGTQLLQTMDESISCPPYCPANQ
ncbi:MAG TPA: hypothetical protein VFN30_00495 [Chitinophagaceae bacterium]|nr:hypothetical protein [Chitinophagaceae bacterium]